MLIYVSPTDDVFTFNDKISNLDHSNRSMNLDYSSVFSRRTWISQSWVLSTGTPIYSVSNGTYFSHSLILKEYADPPRSGSKAAIFFEIGFVTLI